MKPRIKQKEGGPSGHPPFISRVRILLVVIQLQRCESTTCKEQVLLVQEVKDRVTGEIDLDAVGPVTIVNDALVSGGNVIACPGSAPPAGGDTHLNPVTALGFEVEGTVLYDVPGRLREGCDTLVETIVAIKGEAVFTSPGVLPRPLYARERCTFDGSRTLCLRAV